MALHILPLCSLLFAALSVALGEAQAGPSGAALPPAPQQPAVRVEEAAMTSSSGGGAMAGAASTAPTVLGFPYLGQNAPPVSHALQPAFGVTSSQHAAAGPSLLQMSQADAGDPGMSAAGMPSVRARRKRHSATDWSDSARRLLLPALPRCTSHAAMQQNRRALDATRHAWKSNNHARRLHDAQYATNAVGNVAAGGLAADTPAAMSGSDAHAGLHPEHAAVGGSQAAVAEGPAAL